MDPLFAPRFDIEHIRKLLSKDWMYRWIKPLFPEKVNFFDSERKMQERVVFSTKLLWPAGSLLSAHCHDGQTW
jgi:hypothetical protein